MPSFDVVSKVDIQEARNAVDQTLREVHTAQQTIEIKQGIEADFQEKSV